MVAQEDEPVDVGDESNNDVDNEGDAFEDPEKIVHLSADNYGSAYELIV